MICYFDTSAFLPLLVAEPGTPKCQRLWRTADAIASSLLLYVEAAAALAQAERLERIDGVAYRGCMRRLDALWAEINVIGVGETLVERAGVLARVHGLRAYDAVHCAAAERVKHDEIVVASGDHRVLMACEAMGFAVSDTSA